MNKIFFLIILNLFYLRNYFYLKMFRLSSRVLLLLLTLSSVGGEDLEFTYIENGADWPNDFSEC